MSSHHTISPWLRRFFADYITKERNLSVNTKRSYRDTFVLLLPYLQAKARKSPDRLLILDMKPKHIRSFLDHIETQRGCSVQTRNIRLTALRSFARFVSSRDPAYSEWAADVCAIATKKPGAQKPLEWLTREEMEMLVEAVDISKSQGNTELALLVFLFNTGARVSEAIKVQVHDLQLHQHSNQHALVTLHGKGGKVRQCPLWPKTMNLLAELIKNKIDTDPVFTSQRQQPYTRFGVYRLVQRCKASVPSLSNRQVTPHVIRHACACNLLKSGVDLNTIRAWLGHVNLDTTNIYAQVDLDLKFQAMQHCDPITTSSRKLRKQDEKLMDYLSSM